MRDKFFLILLVLTFLFIASNFGLVSASISNVSFSFAGEPLTLFGRLETPVTMSLNLDNISNTSTPTLFADLTPLNPKPSLIPLLSNKKFTCSKLNSSSGSDKDSYFCKTDFDLIVTKPEINVSFNIVLDDGKTLTENKTLKFDIDDTHPEITAIRSDLKVGDYYVLSSLKPTRIYFDIKDSKGSFNNRNLFFGVGSNPTMRVVNCSNTGCYGFFIGSCGEDHFQKVFITGQSSDDAGNSFSGVTKADFKCDITPPYLHGSNPFSISFDNSLYPNPKSGDTIIISLLIDEDVSGVEAKANFSGLTNDDSLVPGNCILEERGYYNCSWKVSNVQSGDHSIKFFIKDGVGRELSNLTSNKSIFPLEKNIHVDIFQSSKNGSTPIFFQPVIGKISAPYGYNRIAIDLALKNGFDYPLYATYNLQRTSIGGSVQILRAFINPAQCVLKSGSDEVSALNYFSDIKIKNPLLNYDKTNRVSFVLSPNTNINDLSDSFDILCNLSLIVRDDNKVYEKPSNTLFKTTMKFKNSALGDTQPGAKLVEQIKTKEKRINSTWKLIGTLDKIAGTLSGVCNLDKTLTNSFTTAVTGQLGSFALGAVSAPAGEAVRTTASTMLKGIKRLDDPLMKSSSSPKSQLRRLMTTACEWSTCSLDKNGKNHKDNWYFSGFTNLEDVAEKSTEGDSLLRNIGVSSSKELFSNVNIPNPKESIVSSLFSRCWPGVIYNLNKYREIECNALLCMKQQSKAGLDLSVCSKTQSQAICKNILGEAFDLPYVRDIKNIMNNADSFVQLIIPNTLKYVSRNTFCKDVFKENVPVKTLGEKATVFVCNLPESIGNQLNMKYKTTSSGTNFQYPVGNDVCALAMCNDNNLMDCQKTNSFVDNWIDNTLKALGLNSLPGSNIVYKPEVKAYSINDYQKVLDEYNSAKSSEDKEKYFRKLRRMGAVTNITDIPEFKKSLELNLKLAGNNSNALLAPSRSGSGFYLTTFNPSDYAAKLKFLQEAKAKEKISPSDLAVIDKFEKLKNELEDAKSKNDKEKIKKLQVKIDQAQEDARKKVNNFDKKLVAIQDARKKAGLTEEDIRNDVTEETKFVADQINSLNSCFTKECNRQKTLLDLREKELKKLSETKNSKDYKKIEDNFNKEYKDHLLSYQVYDQLGEMADFATSFLINTGILNYGVLSNYGSDTTVGKISSFADTYLNSDHLITGICSPTTRVDIGSGGEDLGAVQCIGNKCSPVLTFGAERVTYSSNSSSDTNSSYLYTLVYALGPVYPENSNQNESIKYNIYLVPSNGDAPKKLFNVEWKELPLSYPLVNSLSFVGKNEYSKICINFKDKYPPKSVGAKKEFCRTIVDADNGRSSFDTGSPLSKDYSASGSNPTDSGAVQNSNEISGDI